MYQKILCMMLSITLLLGGLVNTAGAAMITTQEVLSHTNAQTLQSSVKEKLSRAEVQQAMIALGVDPEQASLRVSALSPDELAKLDAELDSLPAGGSVLALIGAVFVVLLILELTGVIDIFKKA